MFGNMLKHKRGTLIFSMFVLLDIYSYFMTFQVAGGIQPHLTYLLWGFWLRNILQLVTYRFARYLSAFRK
jgi:hypothetical protein